ncbi:MAG TPA: molybdopterin-dependent oxidoreductase, partial [Candidatus Kryptonia bacterium]|nr:molybdopterin-dependent oxidoreductase [Candidatus Kryptonia bacterium]
MTQKWPVLSYGPTPRFDPANWDFRIFGDVAEPRRLSYEEFRALPQSSVLADFHCVTTWSRLDNRWTGVLARDVVALVQPHPAAQSVLIHCDGGYTTNLSVPQLSDVDVIFAHRHDGADLSPEHGWPLRLV